MCNILIQIINRVQVVSEKVEKAIDSTQSKTGKILEKGAEKLNEAADKLKEASKK